MRVIPGVLLALGLALGGYSLANLIGMDLLGLPRSPISPIMMAILLGILVRNLLRVPAIFEPGIRFSLVRILRLGIVLLGIRLSLTQAGEIGLKSLPVIISCVAAALLIVSQVSKRVGLTTRLGTLIAAGTGICGATAIVALSPSIDATDDETSYSVACITLFGLVAMLAYPFAANWLFDGDAFRIGLFLGTAVHETAQVAGSGIVYSEYFGSAEVLNTATVTKLVRNMCMLIVVPLLSIAYHRKSEGGQTRPGLWSMVPWFVIGFAMMSLLRTTGDMGELAFGFLPAEIWHEVVNDSKQVAEICLGIAMAAVGLGTSLSGLKKIGLKPLGVGLFSAVLVGAVSFSLISLLY